MGYASSIYENPANKLAYIHFDELHFRITKNSGGFRPTTVADEFAYFFLILYLIHTLNSVEV